jgi:hypothetical protein
VWQVPRPHPERGGGARGGGRAHLRHPRLPALLPLQAGAAAARARGAPGPLPPRCAAAPRARLHRGPTRAAPPAPPLPFTQRAGRSPLLPWARPWGPPARSSPWAKGTLLGATPGPGPAPGHLPIRALRKGARGRGHPRAAAISQKQDEGEGGHNKRGGGLTKQGRQNQCAKILKLLGRSVAWENTLNSVATGWS